MTREEAIYQIKQLAVLSTDKEMPKITEALNMAIESLSVEWITDRKPTKSGTYMVTLDAFGLHRFVDILIYGKPIMPNRKVRGKCWYRSDDEWGDVVYDDEDILAWMPLPKPYGESEVEE